MRLCLGSLLNKYTVSGREAAGSASCSSLRKQPHLELDEQHEDNEQLQARIKSLEKYAWYDMAALLYPLLHRALGE